MAGSSISQTPANSYSGWHDAVATRDIQRKRRRRQCRRLRVQRNRLGRVEAPPKVLHRESAVVRVGHVARLIRRGPGVVAVGARARDVVEPIVPHTVHCHPRGQFNLN
eukprot:m.454892 g.454892  ORF g.454892 m.454892 type:complete len:108 (-) comp20759_c0_seq1:1794-2117(-)